MKKIYLFSFLLLSAISMYSQDFEMDSLFDQTTQEGKIIGNVYDGNTNKATLAFAEITVKELDQTIKTDRTGAYQLNLKPGTYTIVYSFIGYENAKALNVEVKNQQTIVLNKTLRTSTPQFDFAAVK